MRIMVALNDMPNPSAMCPSSSSDSCAGSCSASRGTEDLAERYKTKMCANYMRSGTCPYDVRCDFAHGEEDLHTVDVNRKLGLTTREAIKLRQRHLMQQQQQQQYAYLPPPPHFYDAIPNYEMACCGEPWPAYPMEEEPCYINDVYVDLLSPEDHDVCDEAMYAEVY